MARQKPNYRKLKNARQANNRRETANREHKDRKDKEKEAVVIKNFRSTSTNITYGSYFNSMLKHEPDRPYYHSFFNECPDIDLNEVLYRRPSNRLIDMMMDASRYAHSKIQPYIDKRDGLVDSDEDVDTDADDDVVSVESRLLGEVGFGEDKVLSQKTIEAFCGILPRCMPFNSHLLARHDDADIKNCWCPCSPPIWNWLVEQVPSLKFWSSNCNDHSKNIHFPMTCNNVHLHLRKTKCPLHHFAEYYQLALMTFYYTEVKLNGPELCCMPEKSLENQQEDSNSDPPYERDSPHLMPTSSSIMNCDGDNNSIASPLPIESNVISEVVNANWNDTSWNEFMKRPQNTSSNIDSKDPLIVENKTIQHSPHVMPKRSLTKNSNRDNNSIASPLPVVPIVICDDVKPNWNDTNRNDFVKRPQNTSFNDNRRSTFCSSKGNVARGTKPDYHNRNDYRNRGNRLYNQNRYHSYSNRSFAGRNTFPNRRNSDTFIHEEDRYHHHSVRRSTQRYNSGGTRALDYYGPSRKTNNVPDDSDNCKNKADLKSDEAYSSKSSHCDNDHKMACKELHHNSRKTVNHENDNNVWRDVSSKSHIVKYGDKSVKKNHNVGDVKDLNTRENIPTSEVSVSSSNKRKAISDISPVTSHSSKAITTQGDPDMAAMYKLLKLVMANELDLPFKTKSRSIHSKSKASSKERSNGRKEVNKEKLVVVKKNNRLSPEEYEGSDLKLMWDKRKLKKKRARQRKRLIQQGKSVDMYDKNSSNCNVKHATPSVQEANKFDILQPGNTSSTTTRKKEISMNSVVSHQSNQQMATSNNKDKVVDSVLQPDTTNHEHVNNDNEDEHYGNRHVDNNEQFHPDYDLTSDVDREDDEVNNNQNSDDVNPYPSDNYLRINDVQNVISDVSNISDTFQNKNQTSCSVHYDADYILRMVDENSNYNKSCEVSAILSPKNASPVDVTSDCEPDTMLLEYESHVHNHDELSTTVLSTMIPLDATSEHNVAELNRINLVQSKLNAAKNCSIVELLDSDVSYIEKNRLVNGIQSLLAIFNVCPERPMCVRNVFYSNLPSYVMDGHTKFCSNNVNRVSNETHVNVLLIGIGYSRELLEQWQSPTSPLDKAIVNHNPLAVGIIPALNDFLHLDEITKKLTEYSTSVKRDFLRGLLLEDMFHPCRVHTVTLCMDSIRDSINGSPYELNCNVCSRDFVMKILSKGWKLDQICIDHYRMFNEYVAHNFGKNFFLNLKGIARADILLDKAKTHSGRGEIYLPLCPHFFLNVHAAQLEEEYSIKYVMENELMSRQNFLHSVTHSETHEHVANYYGVEMSFQDRHLKTTMSQLMNYSVGIDMSREDIQNRIRDINGTVEDVRYICLIKKINTSHDYCNYLSYTNTKPIVLTHDLKCSNEIKLDFKSKYVSLPFDNPLKKHCNTIIDKLMLNPMDTYHGISVVCEQPMGNKIMLNINRPAVLRQYYGADIAKYGDNTIERFTYGYGSKRNSVGSDPNKFVTKPFDDNMHQIADYLHVYLSHNTNVLELQHIDVTKKFNSCTLLVYYGHETIKKKSSMGYHCDNSYNDKGVFAKSMNSHVENTPTVIVSNGSQRTLNWQKINRSIDEKGKKFWSKDKSFKSSMVMNENSIVIINPMDEIPHSIGASHVLTKYQHGNVLVKANDNISFAFVFRVVEASYKYNAINNVMLPIIGNATKKEHDKALIRENIYLSSDIEKHHNCLKSMYLKNE